MDWIPLTDKNQLQVLSELSLQKPQVIFKHSTRCHTSSLAWNRLQKAGEYSGADCYFLDLIKFRSLSSAIAETFQVEHESPQILLIKNGKCTYTESHLSIYPEEILEQF